MSTITEDTELTDSLVSSSPHDQQTVLYHESYRPQFHFTAKANWINDPNGLVYFAGEYHLFYQHNPTGINWGNMHWGHAVSPDLVHWKELPVSLEPDHLGAIFSGSAVVDWNNTTGLKTGSEAPLIAMYTAAGGESPETNGQPYTQCLAYSTDRGRTWHKYGANPVLPHVVGQNRDPKVIWFEPRSCWIMSLFLDGEDYALFSSPNLKHWIRMQTIHLPGASECPDFFSLPVEGDPDSRYWVFCGANGHYLVGDFDGRKFTQHDGPCVLDYGANYYAVQTYSDIPIEDGRCIQVAWMAGGNYPGMNFNQQMSFPAALTLHRTPVGLRMRRNPVKEIELLRQRQYIWIKPSAQDLPGLLAEVQGGLYDLNLEFRFQATGSITIAVYGSEFVYDFSERSITLMSTSAPLLPEDNIIKLRVLIDRTSIEIFANDGRVTMSFCYSPDLNVIPLSIEFTGPAPQIESLEIYQLGSAWTSS